MAAPKKKKSGSKKKTSKTGKPPLSEPKIQVFSMFGGISFQLAAQDFNYIFDTDLEDQEGTQTDQFGNLMVLQNNANLAPNKTIETRQNLVQLFEAPVGQEFNGVALLTGDRIYLAATDTALLKGTLPAVGLGVLTETAISPVDEHEVARLNDPEDNAWTFLGHADNTLVGMTSKRQIFTAETEYFAPQTPLLEPHLITPPIKMLYSSLTAKGSLTISATATETCPFRVGITHTITTMHGPTTAPAVLYFYASKPTSEWSSAAYVRVTGVIPNADWVLGMITGVELYFTEGDALDPAFLARVDESTMSTTAEEDLAWSYNWRGYLVDVSNWTIANLKIPDRNYTAGVQATHMTSLDGVLYFWGGEPEDRVWIGGGPGNRFSVSGGTGGGYVDCESGTGVKVRKVLKFKTQQGAAIVTILADSENSSQEHRFNLVDTRLSISSEQSVKAWSAEKIAGTVGCKSPTGALVAGDGLYAVSRYGLAITTLTMEYNSQLQVQYVSDPIEPVFLKQYGNQLKLAVLFSVNGILYMTFGTPDGDLDNVIFCYDIGLKAWWTHTLDLDTPILNMIHIDHEDTREGIGIVTADAVYLLPTTRDEAHDVLPLHDVLIESAELCAVQPMQGMQHLTQLEFRWDYFIGDMILDVAMVDQFGRKLHMQKRISHDTLQYKLSEYIRIDKVVSSYRISLKGKANMRLTHFMSKAYPKSNRIGSMWGFDSRQSHTSSGSVQRTFNDYNDLKAAIIP